jgi:hypothetical protein
MEFISIKTPQQISGIIIDNNNNVLISTERKFSIYKIDGSLIKDWEIHVDTFGYGSRNIAFNKDEIFMINSLYNCVYVFSYEGTN